MTSRDDIRVLLVDDHPLLLDVTRRSLDAEQGIRVVAMAGSAAQAREVLASTPADVLVLDISLPDGSGLRLISEVLLHHPEVNVMVLTMHADPSICRAALDRGALGFLTKGCSPEQLTSSVRAVAAGERVVPPELVTTRRRSGETDLSEREVQVMLRLVEGRRLMDIGAELGLSEKTVSTYRTRISAKTGCTTVEDMRRYALLHDLG